MILILILSNNIRNDSHSRPERSPRAFAPGNRPAVSFSLYMGRSYGHPADPCLSPRQTVKPADPAAPCANPPGVPILGTVPTGAPDLEYL